MLGGFEHGGSVTTSMPCIAASQRLGCGRPSQLHTGAGGCSLAQLAGRSRHTPTRSVLPQVAPSGKSQYSFAAHDVRPALPHRRSPEARASATGVEGAGVAERVAGLAALSAPLGGGSATACVLPHAPSPSARRTDAGEAPRRATVMLPESCHKRGAAFPKSFDKVHAVAASSANWRSWGTHVARR